jgi:hypothetical protein
MPHERHKDRRKNKPRLRTTPQTKLAEVLGFAARSRPAPRVTNAWAGIKMLTVFGASHDTRISDDRDETGDEVAAKGQNAV